ncbi:hypothetical protein [Salipiger abyssi]|uniref:RNA polymerase sigma-54 factor n=1 Tax=Salipiger abyssi TaxID=1250539 RepID=A0A1P8UW71_9RHOB|nr:hypothetical protein [Salipiger abyssi]APZ53630.1 RNA polymerase, sigma 54 subunit, RpoN/SigL [Salipiger abyssi]
MTPGLGLVTTTRQSFVLGQSMTLLRMSAAELTEHLLEVAQVNPLLRISRPRRRLFIGNAATDVLEAVAAAEASSLFAHATNELTPLLAGGGPMARAVTALIEELEPSGWFGGDLEALAARLGVATSVMERVLALVQRRISPAGLFARDLAECLRLQLEEREAMTPALAAMLPHLGLLERGTPATLARTVGLTVEAVAEGLAVLRGLDPKPGARFASDPTLGRAPDAAVERGAQGWQVRLLRGAEPELEVRALPDRARTESLAEAQKQARMLKQAMALRQSAMRQVLAALVARQQGYFDHGAEALAPLTMAGLGAATGFHPSTVSRVLNGYLLDTPQGVIAARVLCAGAASKGTGAHSRAQVTARLCAHLGAEDPAAPLSDARLVALLLAEGITISRRMVAKYRQQAGYAPAALRRRRA